MTKKYGWLAAALSVVLAGCGKQPVEEALSKNDRGAVAKALEAGGDVNATTSSGDTPLLMATRLGQSSSAQGLIENGADLTARDQDGNRLRLDFDVGLGALGSDSSKASGRFALTSALRFNPSTRGLHLQDPRIENVDVPALGGAMNASARAMLNSWLAEYAREEPVYRLDNSLTRDSGRYVWEVPDENLWKFYVRARAVDKASNTGEHIWSQKDSDGKDKPAEVIVDLETPAASINKVRGGNTPKSGGGSDTAPKLPGTGTGTDLPKPTGGTPPLPELP